MHHGPLDGMAINWAIICLLICLKKRSLQIKRRLFSSIDTQCNHSRIDDGNRMQNTINLRVIERGDVVVHCRKSNPQHRVGTGQHRDNRDDDPAASINPAKAPSRFEVWTHEVLSFLQHKWRPPPYLLTLHPNARGYGPVRKRRPLLTKSCEKSV